MGGRYCARQKVVAFCHNVSVPLEEFRLNAPNALVNEYFLSAHFFPCLATTKNLFTVFFVSVRSH